jgi:hypothetical protein
LPGLTRAPDGTLTTVAVADAAPVVDVARPLTWQRRDDGRWQARPPLPEAKWWVSTLLALLLSLVLVRHPLPLARGRR